LVLGADLPTRDVVLLRGACKLAWLSVRNKSATNSYYNENNILYEFFVSK
jgi:hypothetical protein